MTALVREATIALQAQQGRLIDGAEDAIGDAEVGVTWLLEFIARRLRSNLRVKNDESKTGREGRQFIAAHLLPDAAKQFKLLAVQHEKMTQDLLVEAINDLFAKHGLSRIA
jgi:hypothetical protein